MKHFSVPADFSKETIDSYDRLNQTYPESKVSEIYGNITIGNSFGSGRSHSQLPKIDFKTLREFVKYSRSRHINFNYTLNTSHMMNREFTEEGIREIKQFLNQLYETGIRHLTLTLPSLFELVISTGLDFKIKASAICSIDNVNIALAFKKKGASKIVIKEMINRDFFILKKIRKAFGDQIELIINSPCHIDCSYRMSHYNQQSGDSIKGTNVTSFNYYEHKCMLRRYSELGNWLKIIWIRPEDLKYYTRIGIQYFKLQGRQSIIHGGDLVKVTECYFKEDYDGDLIDLINAFAPLNHFKVHVQNKKLEGFIKPFFEKEHFCIRDCTECDYCDRFAENCVDLREAGEVCDLAQKFYQEFDHFKDVIHHQIPQKTKIKETELEQNGDFEF
jgi:collagenase-like PrtC family protease